MTPPSDRWLVNRGALALGLLFLLALAGEGHPYFGFDGWAGFGLLLGGGVALAAVGLARLSEALLPRARRYDDD